MGIDLGTTYSLLAIMDGIRPRVIPNAEGDLLTPSVVAFLPGGGLLVGKLAKRQAAANPERASPSDGDGGGTIASIKRKMGSDFLVRVRGRAYTPEEISALILRKLKEDAEAFLGEPIERAVVTVPAYFGDRQRQATQKAGALAGLEVVRLLSEPTAAALAYGLHRRGVHTVMVWDLGGGTFDVSILELGEGVFEVKAVNGDTHLGGDDFDERLLESLADEFRASSGVELRSDPAARQRLKEAAEKTKCHLSRAERAPVRLPFIAPGAQGPLHLRAELTRERFEALTADLRARMVAPTERAMADAGVGPEDIDRLILAGGATRMPAVRALAESLMGKSPIGWIDPDKVVACGAAIQAGILSGAVPEVALIDVTPLSLGIETQGGLFARVIERNTPLPARSGRVFTTAAEGQRAVDIHVLQGERPMARDNLSLGRFRLEDIPPQPAGQPRVEVSFSIDVDGVVRVSAVDLQTENLRQVEIAAPLESLPQDQVGRILQEAERFAAQDEEQRSLVGMALRADRLIEAAERCTEAARDPAREALGDALSQAVLAAKGAIVSGDPQAIRARSQELEGLLEQFERSFKGGGPSRTPPELP